MKRPTPWYVSAFGSDYLRVYPHRDVESARREIAGLIALGLRGRVLDLACGFGRHVVAMREQGIDVVGIDLSAALLSEADPAIRPRLVRADSRALPFREHTFDGVVSLFSSFGYFGEAGDRVVLAEVARVLREEGILILDLANPEFLRSSLVPRSRTERNGFSVEETRRLADGGARILKVVELTDPAGARRTWTEDLRLYARHEIEALVHDVGIQPVGFLGDLAGEPMTPHAKRQVLIGRRRGIQGDARYTAVES